ncbi:hypothetical protein [Bordetella sp. 2513F-2]
MADRDFTDATLMAYADGMLDDETAAQVEASARADARVAARIALFRQTGAALRQTAQARRAEPLPQALRDRVQQMLDEARAPQGSKVLPFQRPARPDDASGPARPRRAMAGPLALAASLALAVGLGAGMWMAPQGGQGEWLGTAALEHGGVAEALARVESGARASVAAGEVTLVASFLDGQGALCREFELEADSRSLVSVACHDGSTWDLRFAAAAGGSGGYAPASSLGALDAYLAAAGAGQPLSPGDEAKALARLADRKRP